MIRRLNPAQLLTLFALLIGFALLSGCGALGVPTPDTFNKKAAVAIATVTEVRGTGQQLLAAGKISPDDAANVQKQADIAREGIVVARMAATKGDLANADTRLEAVTAALKALQTYLIQRQGAKS